MVTTARAARAISVKVFMVQILGFAVVRVGDGVVGGIDLGESALCGVEDEFDGYDDM